MYYCCIEQEKDKIFMIQLTHAVTNPRTVMVHAQDALLADPAVMDSFLFDQVAFKAVSDAIQRVDLVSKHD